MRAQMSTCTRFKHGASLTSVVALLELSLSLTRLQQILDGLVHDLKGSHIDRLHLCWQPPLLDVQEQTFHQCCAQTCSRSVVKCFSKPLCVQRDMNSYKATVPTR